MHNYPKTLLLVFIITIFAGISSAQRKYTITEIQTPANVLGIGLLSINNEAEVVGSASVENCVEVEDDGNTRATSESTAKTKNTNLASRLSCIPQSRPVYWSNGTGLRILSTPAYLYRYYSLGGAVEINNSGQIVGKVLHENINGNTIGSNYIRAVTWTNYSASFQWLTPPISGSEYANTATPFVSINNGGRILFSQCIANDSPYSCSFINWIITGIGQITPPGVYVTNQSKINDRGEVLFSVTNSNSENDIFLYSQNSFIDITPSLAANES